MSSALKILLFCMVITTAVSCNKEGDEGPIGNPGPDGEFFVQKQGGRIQGTITGTQGSTGSDFTISFDHTFYEFPDNISFNGLDYDFYLLRSSSAKLESGYCWITFSLPTLTSTVPVNPYFSGSFYKDLGNNQVLDFDVSTSNFSSVVISNFSYNASTHIAQGSFNILVNSSDNSTGFSAEITGTFQTLAMTEYVSRIGN